MVAPLRRLGVNKPTPIDKVGSPESILSSIGPFITGTQLCAHHTRQHLPWKAPSKRLSHAACKHAPAYTSLPFSVHRLPPPLHRGIHVPCPSMPLMT